MKWILGAVLSLVATPSYAIESFDGDQIYTIPMPATTPGARVYVATTASVRYTLSGSLTILTDDGERGIQPLVNIALMGIYGGQAFTVAGGISPFYFPSGMDGQTVDFSIDYDFSFSPLFETDGIQRDLRVISSATVAPASLGAFNVAVNSFNLAFTSGEFAINYVEEVLPVPGVPEPGTWSMMIAGFGMMGAGLRYRRRSSTVAFA
ncbi:PEPxxWA-CTERM sorting domain-containing protein [Sphingomonas echinoides]|uniref:PEPxxWA-CTERM sorting domain-containing protein n=1 Tax=Sphingomonas echinoides TaxID=59803 RepID=UPI0024137498|nr:PEPxxWA-CTERM sorting domain-containing protein [Sphingomonas echinoides]